MLTVPSVHVLNWLFAYHKFCIPSFGSYPVQIFGEVSFHYTPKIFLESHLLRATSGTRTFTVWPTFSCGNFSLASIVILNACVCRLLFTIFFFQLSCSFAEHILMKNGVFLWMAHLLHMFLAEIPILTIQH